MEAISVTADGGRSISDGTMFVFVSRTGSKAGQDYIMGAEDGLAGSRPIRGPLRVSVDTHNRVRSAAVPLSGGDTGWRTAARPSIDIYREKFESVSLGWPM
jgi:hypothetical protein